MIKISNFLAVEQSLCHCSNITVSQQHHTNVLIICWTWLSLCLPFM